MARYTDLEFPTAWEDFAAKHVRPGDSVDDVIDRLVGLTRAKTVSPDALSPVTSSRVCEFLGWSREWWNKLMTVGSNARVGAPPPPRAPGRAQRGPGVSDLWFLELDIVPWLMGTPEGTELLRKVIGHILRTVRATPAGSPG